MFSGAFSRWFLLVVTLGGLGGASLLAGCGGTVECEGCGGGGGSGSSSGGGGAACASGKGELHGNVFLYAPEGEEYSEPAGSALVQIRDKVDDAPLLVKAGEHGAYTVELEAGTWFVGGESADGYCSDSVLQSIIIDPCGSLEIDVVLDECLL